MRNTSKNQSGQTLIETVVALFVLTTGLAAGLSLAIYSFSSSTDVSRRIVATALAREGIEVARRMRDSNWLSGTLSDCGSSQFCYSTWLSSPYDITGSAGNGREYRVQFLPSSTSNKWALQPTDANSDYRLYAQSGGGLSENSAGMATQFFRKITMVYAQTSSPYSAASPLVLVRSSVWWNDKRCPSITYLNAAGDNTQCKVVTEEYLTNWRNY